MARSWSGWSTSPTTSTADMNNEGDDTPHVIVKLRPGKSEQQERRLARRAIKTLLRPEED